MLFALLGLVTDSLWALAAGTAGGMLRRSRRFVRTQRYVTGTVYIGLGVATAFAGAERRPLAAAVDRDRKLERHLGARGDLRLEPLDDLVRARRRREQPPLDLLGRVELEELLLELLREASAARGTSRRTS